MKVFLDSIGCRLNQSEIEKLAAQFRAEGHQIIANADLADLVVINTCAVTVAASADSRNKIRSAARSGKAKIVATGCYATIDPQAIASLPGVDSLIPNLEKDQLVAKVLGLEETELMEPGIRKPLPGAHRRTRAFIKVQDGCDNFCTFCITRIARGANRSQSEGEIFADIDSALAGGVKEIVLSGVNLGAWGMDMEPQRSLAYLIERIVAKFSPPRIRFSSLEPWDINDEFLDILGLPGFCNHLHLPLQSGSDSVLKRMGRRSSTGDFESIVNKVRLRHPEISLTTDVMVGFPGESEAEFKAGLDFVRRMSFAGGHVFSFSSRPGTAADDLPGHLQADIKKARSAEMRALIMLSANDYRKKFIGKELSILWEKSTATKTGFSVSGLSDNFIRVQASSIKDLYNQITPVRIRQLNDLVLHADQIF